MASRCEVCVRQHQRCIFSKEDGVCDRCRNGGYTCRFPSKKYDVQRRRTGKCGECRRMRQRCEPQERKWPTKCVTCIRKGLPCSQPMTAAEYRDALGEDDIDGQIYESLVRSDIQDHTDNAFMPIDLSPSTSSTSDGGSDIPPAAKALVPAPALPSAKRKRTANDTGSQEIDQPQQLQQRIDELENTLGAMEDEFQAVLKAEQKKYESALEEERQNRKQEKERYEQRIDGLIQTIVNISNPK